MCGDSVDQLSKALIPNVPTADVADIVAAVRGGIANDDGSGDGSAESTPIRTPESTPATSPVVPRALIAPTETIIYKATVLTLAGGKFSATEALAVRGDTIVATGTVDEVRAAVTPSAATVREVDYGSRVIMPGFIDPHVHLLMTALTSDGRQFVDLTYPGVRTKTDALDTLARAVEDRQATPSSEVRWIAGFGFDPSLVQDHPDLTIDQLDGIAPPAGKIALYVMNQSGHVGYVNSVALTALGIGIRPGEPGYPADDENYQKNETDGSLTGLLFEDAVGAAGKQLPKPTAAEAVAGARAVLQRWTSRGITTVFDCGIGVLGGLTDVALLRLVLDRRTLPDPERTVLPRFHGALTSQTVQDLVPAADLLKRPPWHLTSDALAGESAGSVYGIKFWLDGSTQGFTAAVYEPYRGQPDNFGILNFRQGPALDAAPDDDRLVALVQPFVRGGWQIVMHANGARALDQALRVYARVLAAEAAPESDAGGAPWGRTRNTHMHRLEHVTADITAQQLQRAAQLGLGVSHLIAHVRRWGDAFAQWVLGAERAARLDAVADAAAAGVTYSFHSDSPISEADPLQYVETAASRVLEATGRVLGPSQRVTVEQAFAGITCNPARQLGRQDEIGTLEAGKKADFVVLGADPRTVEDASRLASSVAVLETWIGGRLAFARDAMHAI